MTANNGWLGKPGVPLNPEQDGWHWLCHNEIDQEEAALWNAKGNFWQLTGTDETFSPRDLVVRKWGYLATILTLDETAALQKRCEEAERERDALRRDASQEIATDEMVRRLQHLGDWQAADRIEALQARVAELEGALKDAVASVKEWGAYASQYFQDKWDLPGEVARYIAIAEGKNDVALTGGKDE